MTRLGPIIAACAICLPTLASAADFKELFPNRAPSEYQDVEAILESLDYQQGEILLPGGHIKLAVPDDYYYLNPRDASLVLQDLWGNPGGSDLGMIFPAQYTPWHDEAWGAELEWEDIGYVEDKDAATIDYDDLLRDMQRDTRAESRARVDQGYDSLALVGWAEAPSYDDVNKQLHWALELKFGGSDENTLNYELRSLGRKGTLNTNFIGKLSHLEEIKAALPEVAGMVSFQTGQSYADFDPSLDSVAAVGIAGLIAGKAAGKAGLLAAGLLLLKKFWFVLLLPLAGLNRMFARR